MSDEFEPLNLPFPAENISSLIPEKCRDCPMASFTVAIFTSFEGLTGGPGNYTKGIEDNCPGYDIAPSDVTALRPHDVETAEGQYSAIPIPTNNQLARCAMHLD